MEDVVVTGITHDRGQAKVSIRECPIGRASPRACSAVWDPRTSWWT